MKILIPEYRFDTVNIERPGYPTSDFNALVILKPTQPFSDEDKRRLTSMSCAEKSFLDDRQYVREFDSLYKSGGFTAFDRGLNLNDIPGMACGSIPTCCRICNVISCRRPAPIHRAPVSNVWWTGHFPGAEWHESSDHEKPGRVRAFFPNTIDTVQAPGIKKTFLLRSSWPMPGCCLRRRSSISNSCRSRRIRMFTVHDTAVAVAGRSLRRCSRNRVSRIQQGSLVARGTPFRESAEGDPG